MRRVIDELDEIVNMLVIDSTKGEERRKIWLQCLKNYHDLMKILQKKIKLHRPRTYLV